MKKTPLLYVGLLGLALLTVGCTQDRSGGFGEDNPKGTMPEGAGTTGSGIGAGVPQWNPAAYGAPNPTAQASK